VSAYKTFLEAVRPDLLLLNAFPWFQYYLARAAKEAGIPYVMWHHGLVFREMQYLSIPESARERLITWENEVAQGSVAELFLASSSAKEWRKKYPLPEGKYPDSIVSLPIDSAFFGVPHPREQHDIPRIGWVGRWDAIKHPEYVFSLAVRLQNAAEMHAVTRLGKNALIPLDAEEFSQHVTVHDQMPTSALRQFYASMDACVLPSALETLGKVILEAAACGTPTFITRHVGLADVYRQTGMEHFLIEGDDLEKDSARILTYAKTPCTEEFLAYVRTEHRAAFTSTQLYARLQDIAKR
ncbi:MAG: glycosyltransferase family 4 protein, partial [Candidatus Uhrbacteria bacterium]|nr:glycosyltransferase family 4 protein [Candidatus Uhrbacteria bacterium]